MKKKNDKKKSSKFVKYIIFSELMVSVIFLILMHFINVLPTNYFWLLCIIIGIINVFSIILMLNKKTIKNVFGCLISIIIMSLMILGIIYEFNTLDFYKLFGINNYNIENYKVFVLKDSNYKVINDLNNKNISIINKDSNNKINQELNKVLNKYNLDNNDINCLNDFDSNKFEAFILEEAQISLINEENYDLLTHYRVIYEFNIKTKVENVMNNVDILNKSFNIYISGIDTYGGINNVSRSDVNLILSINPKTNKILITSIPRDYYVYLPSKNAKDKLTHAGLYGIDESVKTIENLLNVDLNYYVKVNFTSLIDIVNALDGIDVYSNYAFTSIDGISFKKGTNKLNGEQALSFSRERKAFADGDRQRGKNQQKVLEAIINKLIDVSVITKYNSLLTSLNGKFITNMDTKSITNFIKKQIKNMPKWSIQMNALDGTNAYEYTYSYKKNKLYVMIPNDNSVENGTNLIKSVIND